MLIPDWIVPKTINARCFDKHDSTATLTHTLPNSPTWLTQIHGNLVLETPFDPGTPADGCYTNTPMSVCAIKTADCLPIYLASKHGTEIALLHGGWRGLSQQIIAQGLNHFAAGPNDIIAYLGPAISARHYEIGTEVYDAFCKRDSTLKQAFSQSRPEHYYADLNAIARLQLRQLGVTTIYGGNDCTFSDAERFYSYRRDPQQPGRLLHCLWISL